MKEIIDRFVIPLICVVSILAFMLTTKLIYNGYQMKKTIEIERKAALKKLYK